MSSPGSGSGGGGKKKEKKYYTSIGKAKKKQERLQEREQEESKAAAEKVTAKGGSSSSGASAVIGNVATPAAPAAADSTDAKPGGGGASGKPKKLILPGKRPSSGKQPKGNAAPLTKPDAKSAAGGGSGDNVPDEALLPLLAGGTDSSAAPDDAPCRDEEGEGASSSEVAQEGSTPPPTAADEGGNIDADKLLSQGEAATKEKNEGEADDETSSPSSPEQPSSFERIVQGWEATISSLSDQRNTSQLVPSTQRFEPALRSVLHNLSRCGSRADGDVNETPQQADDETSLLTAQQAESSSSSSASVEPEALRPIAFQHTHSLPLQYTPPLFDDDEAMMMPDVEPMKRSSSTPSRFRSGSAYGSAFAVRRAARRLDGRASSSAFSQPMLQPRSYAMSDPGLSAFNPVWASSGASTTASGFGAATAGGGDGSGKPPAAAAAPSAQRQQQQNGEAKDEAPQKSGGGKGGTRAKKIMQDIKAMRRRKFHLSGRENPARPPSSSSSSPSRDERESPNKTALERKVDPQEAAGAVAVAVPSPERGEGSLSLEASTSSPNDTSGSTVETSSNLNDTTISTSNEEVAAITSQVGKDQGHPPIEPSSSSDSDDDDDGGDTDVEDVEVTATDHMRVRRYQLLDVEDDDEDARPSSLRPPSRMGSVSPSSHRGDTPAESPTPIPSPSYQQFTDHDGAEGSALGRPAPRTPLQQVQQRAAAVTPQPRLILVDKSQDSPVSHDSGAASRQTTRSSLTNTTPSSHAHTTSTSGTVSSGQITVTSSVAAADREVRDVNRFGRIRRQQVVVDMDGTASVHSSSTASTNPNAYLALASNSPGGMGLREGANMPVDRFFSGTNIQMAPSRSNDISSLGIGGGESTTGAISEGTPEAKASSKKKLASLVGAGNASPTTVSSSSQTNTNSSGSTSEELPRFVSLKEASSSKPSGTSASSKSRGEGERESPAEIIGYERLHFEEAAPSALQQKLKVVKPKKKREKMKRFVSLTSKPPLSPVKTDANRARTPTATPPLPQSTAQSINTGNQTPRSPPVILDSGAYDLQGIDAARPHVLRTQGGADMIFHRPPVYVSSADSVMTVHEPVVMTSPLPGAMTIVGGGAAEGDQEVFTASKAAVVSPESKTDYRDDDAEGQDERGDLRKKENIGQKDVVTRDISKVTPEKDAPTHQKK